MTNIDYTLWPNTDGELGKIKVAIPTNAEDWPAGDALVGNFVYNEGKLAGFVDTKALILNESATTTFPYDYVDISLPSIQEGTLTVNRGERCKYLNIKFYNHEWLPVGFTELDFLESSGTQYIETGVEMTDDTRIKAVAEATAVGQNNSLYGLSDLKNNLILRCRQQNATTFTVQIGSTADVEYTKYERYFTVNSGDVVDVESVSIQKISVNGVTKNGNYVTPWESSVPMHVPIFVQAYTYGATVGYNAHGSYKLYSFAIWQGEEKLRDYVPVLRNADGVAGLYDKVSKQFFANNGTGTFGYKIKNSDKVVAPDNSTTFSLRDPYYVAPSGVYAKLIAENTLEIVTDTEEVQGDDWVHFANTCEAYSHFNIVLPNVE